jgi:arylsulfatase A-like enzyme
LLPGCRPANGAGLGGFAELLSPSQAGLPGQEGYLTDRVAPISALLADACCDTFMAGKRHMGEDREQIPAARGYQRDLALVPGGLLPFPLNQPLVPRLVFTDFPGRVQT